MKIAGFSWLTFVLTFPVLASGYKQVLWLTIPAFFGFFLSGLRLQLGGIKCPRCQVNLFGLIWYPTAMIIFGIPKQYQYCPGCGVNFNESVTMIEKSGGDQK